MNLEALEKQWAAHNERLTEAVGLNQRLLEAMVSGRVRGVMQWSATASSVSVALLCGVLLLLGSYVWEQRRVMGLAVPAVLLHVYGVVLLALTLRGLVARLQVDYQKPVAQIQAQIARIRGEEMRLARWLCATVTLVWIPLVLVGYNMVTGGDPYQVFSREWLVWNVVFGVVMIPVALVVMRYRGRFAPLVMLARHAGGYHLRQAERILAEFREGGVDPMTDGKPIALEAYELLADAYAERVDTKPHNAYCERPGTLSLLPDVKGLCVLDAGCGPGSYSAWMVERGASVVAVDVSPKMVEHARRRLGAAVEVHCANLEEGLPFLEMGTFDLIVSPLVFDYLRDWSGVLRRFAELLKPGGKLVFSVSHPSFNATYYKTERYFEVEAVSATWRGFGPIVDVPCYRRPLEEVLNAVVEAGFAVERLHEPRPTAEFAAADPVRYERLLKEPNFLCIRARKDR